MSFGQPCDEFPLSSLPPLIRDAVIEAQQITQAPLGLVAASALGAVSLVCQNLIDVCRLTEYTAGAGFSFFPDACRVRRTKNRSGQIINEAPVPAGDAVIFQIQK